MVVIDCELKFKAFERIQHTSEINILTTSRIIPNVWGDIWSYNLQEPNQPKKDLVEGVTFLSQVAFSVILCN